MPRSPIDLLVPERQLVDEVMGVGELGHLHDPLAIRVLVAAGDVLGNGAREQQVVLHDIAYLGAVVLLVDQVHVVAVDKDLAFGRRVKPASSLASVLLPDPLWPTMATSSPALISRLMFSST